MNTALLPLDQSVASRFLDRTFWQALAVLASRIAAAASAMAGAGGLRIGNGALTPQPGNFGTKNIGGVIDSPLLCELVNEFLLAKARAGKSDRYLRQLRVSLKHFTGGRARKQICQIHSAELEAWLQKQGWAPKTQKGYLGDVATLFNFAIRRGYLERNPAKGVEVAASVPQAITVHSPDQVKTVLDTARRADLDVCRHLAIRYFAGVRSAEAHRLREEDLKLEQNLLEVPAVKSKTRARRLVTIQPNLRAWLDLGGELRPLGEMTVRHVIRLSKVEWSHNVTRHSFVSYHLAHFGNAAKTALEAGHTEQMTFSNYRAIVMPAAAKEFWEIVPS